MAPPTAATTAASLSQYDTNGDIAWGTLPSPDLPKFVGDLLFEDRLPWGSANPAGDPPNTRVTRYYNFVVTREFKSPDGFNKSVILINNQFPGPLIEANWGDMIEVTVTNNINSQDEGITLHWHGMSQKKTPWYDGVPGVSQCPIAPLGGTFTYTFQTDQYGTGWYHSHYSSQYGDGLYGPMVIYGPLQPEVDYDYDVGPVMISDYFHMSYYEGLKVSFAKPPQALNVSNNLINGKGAYAAMSPLKWMATVCAEQESLNSGFIQGSFIDSGLSIKFSIDNHEMTVIANDYVPVQPYTTKVVTLGAGQRTDVIVNATGSPMDVVWMRSDIDMVCLQTTATIQTGLAAIYYELADTSSTPNTTGTTWESNNCQNDPRTQTVPYYPLTPPEPETVQTVTITVGFNATGFIVMFMDNSSFRADYNDPTLLGANAGQLSFPTERNVYNFGSNSSARLILNNTYDTGLGSWDGIVTNPFNPLRRDTHNLQPGTVKEPSYVVLEWMQDNPGIWPFHCHMAIHASAGMFILAMERPDSIQNDMQIPMVMAQTCWDWELFSSTSFVDQIDSGV
ncbi:Laccase-2 [Talaromyces pinophilus]|nr:Laccase-2 [Talaromyces pinophilus]